MKIFGQCIAMENISHSLAGLAVGEAIHRCLPAELDAAAQTVRRRILLASCWAASNFPDLDIVLTGQLPPPLGYLLHHRGHTHTLMYLLPQALLLAALVWLLWPGARRLLHASQSARIGLAAACGAGLLLHVGLDFLNSYGVHPFHPFDSRWFYGDAVFIVEPVFWVAFGVPLAAMLATRWRRFSALGLMAAVIGFAAFKGFLNLGSVLFLLGLGSALLILGQRRALWAGLFAAFGFAAVQGGVSQYGKTVIKAALQAQAPASRVLDTAMTALPANPLCWSFLSVSRDDSTAAYVIARGTFRLWQTTVPGAACPPGFPGQPSPGVVNIEERTRLSLAGLRAFAATCRGQAWLRFARMPVLGSEGASDVRFAMGVRGNFSTMQLDALAGASCPSPIPDWNLPRSDLLTP